MQVQTGSFLIDPDVSGHQTISIICFQPKAIIFFGSSAGGDVTSEGYAGGVYSSLGFVTSSTDDAAIHSQEDNSASPAGFWAQTSFVTDKCITGNDSAALISFNAHGFTIDWATATDTQIVYWVAIGGDTVSAKVGVINPTGTGNLSFTGVGFQGELLMLLHNRNNGTTNVRSQIDYGFASGSAAAEQWSIQGIANSGAAGTAATFRPGKVDDWAGTTLVSFDSDGFTLNMGGSMGGAPVAYLVLADSDGAFKVGNETQKTSTGTKATTGVGFQPGALLAAGICNATTGTQQANDYQTFGVYDGATYSCMWRGAQDGSNPTNTARRQVSSVLISHSVPLSTTNAEAVVDSFDSDGFTLDWTTADSTARAFGYVAFDTVEGNPCPTAFRFWADLV